MAFSETNGRWLKEERQRLGFNQAELASIGGVSKNTQIAYESGAQAPDLRYLLKVVDAGVDFIYVIVGQRRVSLSAQDINWSLIGEVFRSVEAWAREKGVDVPLQEKLQLARDIYEKRQREIVENAEAIRREMKESA